MKWAPDEGWLGQSSPCFYTAEQVFTHPAPLPPRGGDGEASL